MTKVSAMAGFFAGGMLLAGSPWLLCVAMLPVALGLSIFLDHVLPQ